MDKILLRDANISWSINGSFTAIPLYFRFVLSYMPDASNGASYRKINSTNFMSCIESLSNLAK